MSGFEEEEQEFRNDNSPRIDFSRIDFPSDRMTIREIRAMEPALNTSSPRFEDSGAIGVPSIRLLMYSEREVAELAFELVLGYGHMFEEMRIMQSRPKDCDDDLIEAYMEYNMAETTEEAEQLVRVIKEQARAQAHEALGREPSDDGRGR